MKTLLLCAYREVEANEKALGVNVDEMGQTLIENRIQALQAMGHDVITVLGGPQAELQLRRCPRLADTELVFDTNSPLTLLSNLRSGVFAAPGEPLMVLPLEVAPPASKLWSELFAAYVKVGFGTAATFLHAPYHLGFPLLLTREGSKLLQKTPDLKSLLDTRLKYLEVLTQDLAPLANPL